MSIVLLIGRRNDPHITGIARELIALNQKYVILDSLSFSDSFSVYADSKKTNGEIKLDSAKLNLDDIKSIWNTSTLRIDLKKKFPLDVTNFIQVEWSEGINALWYATDTLWINHPAALVSSSNRLKQLQLAKSIGLNIPRTLITTNPERLNQFFRECEGNIIAKTLGSSQGLPKNKMIFTSRITKNDLKFASDLKYAPCMFQEYVPKEIELRVTIVGNKIHVAEIHSQSSNKTKDDWRRYDSFDKTPYTTGSLRADLRGKLFALLKQLNLNFGAVDLIKTPDDKIVFLEVNPNGRWWWIQKLTRMNIAKDIAISLAEGL